MNWYKIAKNEFNFEKVERDIWNNLLKKEQDRVNISFDLENNDKKSEIKKIKLDHTDKHENNHSLLSQMWIAGGDWENSIIYFKCQTKKGKQNGPIFIHIPTLQEGNINLVKNKKGNYCASDNNGKDFEKINENKLWKSLKKEANKRVKYYYKHLYDDRADYNNESNPNMFEQEVNMFEHKISNLLK